jgi:hypothetical protein
MRCVASLAAVARRSGSAEKAARLWGAVTSCERSAETRLTASERSRYESMLGDLVGTTAYDEGCELAVWDAARQALALD